MEIKRFSKNDSGFICTHCGREVLPLVSSSRNHCPFCLWSRHLDVNPGDRMSDCGGDMEPISAEPNSRRGYIITHRCTKCGAVRRCRAVCGDKKIQPDDMELIIKLTVADR